jgi:hypothetical protein
VSEAAGGWGRAIACHDGGVTVPGYPWAAPPAAPPSPPAPPRRWWLIGTVAAWALILGIVAIWSAAHDPPTVPEQRTVAEALPVLQRATGAVLAAAAGPGRAVVLGRTKLADGCRITPVRDGVEATRDVTMYVQAGQARPALDAVAKGLPAGYRARVARIGSGARVGLQADAGSYVAVYADTLANAQVVTVEVATGCRPPAGTALDLGEPQTGAPPIGFTAALRALGVAGETTTTAVRCPGGGVAATYTVERGSAPADVGRSLQPALGGATVVRADPDGWAYRTGSDSVVVLRDGTALHVSATTPCR